MQRAELKVKNSKGTASPGVLHCVPANLRTELRADPEAGVLVEGARGWDVCHLSGFRSCFFHCEVIE